MATAAALAFPAPPALLLVGGDASRARGWGLPAREVEATNTINATNVVKFDRMAALRQGDEGGKVWSVRALANCGSSDTARIRKGTVDLPLELAMALCRLGIWRSCQA